MFRTVDDAVQHGLQLLADGEPSPGADVGRGEPSPGADVAGRAQSRRKCGRGEPSPGADVGGVSPSLGADVRSDAPSPAGSTGCLRWTVARTGTPSTHVRYPRVLTLGSSEYSRVRPRRRACGGPSRTCRCRGTRTAAPSREPAGGLRVLTWGYSYRCTVSRTCGGTA